MLPTNPNTSITGQNTMVDGRHRRAIGGRRRRTQMCDPCNGTGKRLASGALCLDCRGSGEVPVPAVTQETRYVGRRRADCTCGPERTRAAHGADPRCPIHGRYDQ